MKSLQESILDDVDKQVERALRTVKIKPVWDPVAYVCYNYSWYQVFDKLCEIFNDDDSETQDIINIKIALKVYKEMLWPMRLDINNEDEYVVVPEDSDTSEWSVIKDDCAGTKMWIDGLIEIAESLEHGNMDQDYVFSPHSSGSMLQGMDSPEGIITWCTWNRSECKKHVNEYTKLIHRELSKFGIEL